LANSATAPSYFSQYFVCQIKDAEAKGEDPFSQIRTLYIDRDPDTFNDISLHLQGYHIKPRDGTHFVRLFADAQFYTLPKLMSQLYEESIFISIGREEFQIPRDTFSGPGNSPNYFTLGFAVFFSSHNEVFPGLARENLIRPPSIQPPAVLNRSATIFSELLDLLQGYRVTIRNDDHRASLLRDCRYFNFKGLEQKLIPHQISYNQSRQKKEIVLRLEDILKSGISVSSDGAATSEAVSGWINYARPYEDEHAFELVLEMSAESMRLHLDVMRVEFFGETKARIARLFEVIATKLNLPPTTQPLGLLMASGGAGSQPATPGNTPLSEDLVRVVIDADTNITVDGEPCTYSEVEEMVAALSTATNSTGVASGRESPTPKPEAGALANGPPKKRKRLDTSTSQGGEVHEDWIVRKAQWRLRTQSRKGGKSAVECVLVAVNIDAYTGERGRNAQRRFLS
jgi:hypothetical protein